MVTRSEDFPINEVWSVERQLEFDDQKAAAQRWAAGLRKHDPKQTELNLRSLSYADKQALRAAGYRGDLSQMPPAADSGQLIRKLEHRPSFVETYEGDPLNWMNQFAPPVKHQVLLFRQNESDDAWQERRARETRNFALYGTRHPAPPTPKPIDP